MPRVILRSVFFALCLMTATVPMVARSSGRIAHGFRGWPTEWEGRALVELPLSENERALAADFPGEMAKFSDGRRELLLRWVTQATRQLHSSSDCFRGLGYRVTPMPAMLDANGARWSRALAQRGATRLILRERITDDHGGAWTDVSAWYWNVLLRRTEAPWLAVTLVGNDQDR